MMADCVGVEWGERLSGAHRGRAGLLGACEGRQMSLLLLGLATVQFLSSHQVGGGVLCGELT